LSVILYDRREIGAIPGGSSMVNSTSQYRGMPGKSFRKTSGSSQATGITSRLYAALW
jgi:hypothetical protein